MKDGNSDLSENNLNPTGRLFIRMARGNMEACISRVLSGIDPGMDDAQTLNNNEVKKMVDTKHLAENAPLNVENTKTFGVDRITFLEEGMTRQHPTFGQSISIPVEAKCRLPGGKVETLKFDCYVNSQLAMAAKMSYNSFDTKDWVGGSCDITVEHMGARERIIYHPRPKKEATAVDVKNV